MPHEPDHSWGDLGMDAIDCGKNLFGLNQGGGGFLGGSGLSGIVLDFSFNEVSFFNLIKSTTLKEFSFFKDSAM